MSNDTSNGRLLGVAGVAVMLVCVLLFALGQFHRASGGVLAPSLSETFLLNPSELGAIFSMMFLGMVLLQLPMGMALDRFGVVIVLPATLLSAAAATAYFAFSSSQTDLMISRFVLGASLSAHGAATHILISHYVSNRHFGLANGLVTAFGGIGGLTGTYPLAVVILIWSWQTVFYWLAAGTLGMAFLVLAVLYRMRKSNPDVAADNNADVEQVAPAPTVSLLANSEYMRILVLGFMAYAPITTITGLWAGPFYSTVFNLDKATIGILIAVMFGATIAASFVFGALDTMLDKRRQLIAFSGIISAVALFGAALVPYNGTILVTGFLILMVFVQQFYIPLLAHMQKVVPANMLGRASAVFSLVSVLGIPAVQTGFGLVLDLATAAGFGAASAYRIGFAAIGVCLLLVISVYATGKGEAK